MLFEPVALKNLTLPNRLVRSATYEGLADTDGTPSEKLGEVYRRLADNDVGAIITGFCFVSPEGRAMQPRQCGMDADDKVAPWAKVVGKAKTGNRRTVLIMQLAHAGRQTLARVTGSRPVAPTAGKSPYFMERARELKEDEILRIAEAFGAATSRAKNAGFDAVQVHAAHGYLIHQFLSAAVNHREDKWGQDRSAFLKSVLCSIRTRCGADYPILLKVSGADDDKGGLTPREVGGILHGLDCFGLEAAEVSYGTMDRAFNIFRGTIPIERVLDYNPLYNGFPGFIKWTWLHAVYPTLKKRFIPFNPDYNAAMLEEIKRRARLPLILVGGVRELRSIEATLASGLCCAVSMSRPFLREPDLGRKFKQKAANYSICTNCNACAVMCDSGEPTRCYAGQA